MARLMDDPLRFRETKAEYINVGRLRRGDGLVGTCARRTVRRWGFRIWVWAPSNSVDGPTTGLAAIWSSSASESCSILTSASTWHVKSTRTLHGAKNTSYLVWFTVLRLGPCRTWTMPSHRVFLSRSFSMLRSETDLAVVVPAFVTHWKKDVDGVHALVERSREGTAVVRVLARDGKGRGKAQTAWLWRRQWGRALISLIARVKTIEGRG